jgi:hypothetical protein
LIQAIADQLGLNLKKIGYIILQALGISEVWRWNGAVLSIFILSASATKSSD